VKILLANTCAFFMVCNRRARIKQSGKNTVSKYR